MFVNLSNHPHQFWSVEQKEAAVALSGDTDIVTMNFPYVDPRAGEEDVLKEARRIANSIIVAFHVEETVVLVMGEFNMTFAIVSLLQQSGFRVVASTQSRQTGTGVKPDFTFVNFRDYSRF